MAIKIKATNDVPSRKANRRNLPIEVVKNGVMIEIVELTILFLGALFFPVEKASLLFANNAKDCFILRINSLLVFKSDQII